MNLDQDKKDRILACALDEFAVRNFEQANLSNIVKNAQISRGSLYQYFEDKKDLYLYLMEQAKDKKLVYISEYMDNPMDLPFFELFKKMYMAGVRFAMDNPKMVKMFTNLLSMKGEIYEEFFSKNLDLAYDLYVKLIERDKLMGRIRKNVDTATLAKLVIDMTMNVTLEEAEDGNKDYNYEKMIERITLLMDIFEKGVIEGENNV